MPRSQSEGFLSDAAANGGRAAEPETPQAIADAMRGDAELQALDAQYRTAKTAEAREEAKAKFAARVAELRQGMAQGAAGGAAEGAAQEPPQTREKAPASVPQETAATAPTEAAKPAEGEKTHDTAKKQKATDEERQKVGEAVKQTKSMIESLKRIVDDALPQKIAKMSDEELKNTLADKRFSTLPVDIQQRLKEEADRRANEKPAQKADKQGNPIDKSGKLKVETVKTMAEMTDEDFTAPTRSVQLPQIPPNVDAAIGAGGKPVIIKRNIFQKNASNHPELDAKTSREVLDRALYSPNLVGQTQPISRPNYKVAVQTGIGNAVTVLDVVNGKKNVEIVGWRQVDVKGLESMKRQAEREGGQFLILRPSAEGQPGDLSGRPQGLTTQSIPQAGAGKQGAEAAPAGAKPEAAAVTEAKPAERKPAARRGATPEQLADLQAKIAEAEKVNKTAKADGAKEHAKFSVTVGTTSLTFNATAESIAAAKKLMGKLGRPTNWDRKPTPERVPSAPRPTKVEKAPVDAADVLKDFVAANGQHPDKGLERPMTRNGHDYATDATFAVRTVAKPGAADSGDAKAAAFLENLFKGAAKAGTEAKTTTAELETALAQAMSVKGGRTRFDKKGSPDYGNDLVEVWRTKEGGIAVRARSSAKAGGELNNVEPRRPGDTSAESASDAAYFSGGTLDGASLLGFASGNRLAKICKAFARRGDGEVSVELDGGGQMFRFRGKNLEAVLMAKRGGNGEDLAGYEAASKRKGALYSLGDPRDGEGAQGGLRAESGAAEGAADGGRVDMRRLDPARRTDAKVVAWAKKHGRTVSDGRVTPDAVREYDAQMAQGAAKAVRRWFPDMNVTYHDYGENVTRGRHAIDLRDTAGRDAKVDARNLAKLDAQAEASVLAEWGTERAARDEAGFRAAVETRKAELRSDYESSNGSHVSPVEARRMLAELESGEHAEGYGKIREYLRGVMDETLDAQVKSGLISEETAAKYRAEEPDYIPFKNEFDAASGDFVGRGAVNLGRPEHFTAKGRKSSAGDITAHIFGDYQAYRADEAEFKGMSAKWTAAERREYLAAHPWLKYGKTGKRVVSVLIDGTNKERPRTGVESMGINQLRKLTEGLVRTKSGGYAEPKRPVTDAEKERAKKVMMRKQALVIEKMGR